MYIPSSTAGVWERITNGYRLVDEDTSQAIADLTHASNITKLYGADATGDDLFIYSNQTDTYPRLILYGNDYIKLNATTNSYIQFATGSVVIGRFSAYSGNYSIDLKETASSPATYTGYGRIYTKSDNNLYFKDGDGTEHTVSFV